MPYGIGDFVETFKDIQPGNDDQRKAVFARLADEGGSDSGKTIKTDHPHVGKTATEYGSYRTGKIIGAGHLELGGRKYPIYRIRGNGKTFDALQSNVMVYNR